MSRPLTESAFIAALAAALAIPACSAHSRAAPTDLPQDPQSVAVVADKGTPRPPYQWDAEDAAFLDEVQRGSFNWFWSQAHPASGLVPDRTGVDFASVAGVGFQLAALPIGVERGWVTRSEATDRALLIVRTLASAPTNRHNGIFFHFLDAATGAPARNAYECTASTIDSALLVCGLMTASSYFGGEIATIADTLVEESDWASYVDPEPSEPHYRGFISLGWKAEDKAAPNGNGSLLKFYWADAGDEQRLVAFLATGNSDTSRAVDPSVYYKLRRRVGEYGDGPMVWLPWSGALFTNFFAHCWINYAQLGADDPAAQGVERRIRVDWWENSRRAALMHRRKAIENPKNLPGFGEHMWGLSACDGDNTYLVPGLYPRNVQVAGERPNIDVAMYTPQDNWEDGTVAPYTAGCAIMFLPRESIAALRHYRDLKNSAGEPLVWRDPNAGGVGFLDSFTLATGWHASGCVAIDQGPLILAIENARTGLVWKLFGSHPHAQRAMQRLNMTR
ncbi:MAG: hypothetical protein GIKADHBN_02106 [Phycisphaerales bacterium]|nr:hypothetical protein [Phycisphaerales bacterium]